MSTLPALDSSPNELYEHLDAYDWDNDAEFQGGLRAILGSSNSPEQIEHLTIRARCYFYARKFGTRVDFQGYQQWVQNRSQQTTNGLSVTTQDSPIVRQIHQTQDSQNHAPHGDAPTPASFAEICEMIAEGKPIPGIKEIPDTVLQGQGTQSSATRRKKPWEKDAEPAPTPSWAT